MAPHLSQNPGDFSLAECISWLWGTGLLQQRALPLFGFCDLAGLLPPKQLCGIQFPRRSASLARFMPGTAAPVGFLQACDSYDAGKGPFQTHLRPGFRQALLLKSQFDVCRVYLLRLKFISYLSTMYSIQLTEGHFYFKKFLI